jgi:hypothetical protein
LLYGATITGAGMVKSADLIAARATLVYRGFFTLPHRWYHVLPYIDDYLESEFFAPSPTVRRYHHFEQRPNAGFRIQFTDRFSVNAGVGFSWEVFARPGDLTPPGPTAVPVFVAGWTLRPGRVFTVNGRNAEGDTTLDVTWRDPFGQEGVLVRFRARVAIPVWDYIALTLSYELFARYQHFIDSSGVGQSVWGMSADASLGLRITFARAVQGFAF